MQALLASGNSVNSLLSSQNAEGIVEASAAEGPKLHACKNCQRAKTACTDQRPCPRCLRLGIPCDNDAKTVKRACASCKRAKVKCDLDTQDPCARCRRLGLTCQAHVPNKKKRNSRGGDESDLGESPCVCL